ncbi:MAG: hypothetical protein AAF664_22400 [Planctomycetota bacterium]
MKTSKLGCESVTVADSSGSNEGNVTAEDRSATKLRQIEHRSESWIGWLIGCELPSKSLSDPEVDFAFLRSWKMRHPHSLPQTRVESSDDAAEAWQQLS